jgi:hypothetical protein
LRFVTSWCQQISRLLGETLENNISLGMKSKDSGWVAQNTSLEHYNYTDLISDVGKEITGSRNILGIYTNLILLYKGTLGTTHKMNPQDANHICYLYSMRTVHTEVARYTNAFNVF